MKVKDLFEIRTGYTFRDVADSIEPGDVGLVQAGDINAERLANVPRITFSNAKHLLQAGDILISARGRSFARTVKPDILPAVAASSVIVLRLHDLELNTVYIAQYLNSPAGQAELAKLHSGAYIKTLKKSELEQLKIPIPKKATQALIVKLSENIEQQQQMLVSKQKLLEDIYSTAIHQISKGAVK